MYNNYRLKLKEDDIKYTENNIKTGSYHYSIPMWNTTCENLKEIHKKLLKEYKSDFIYKKDKKNIYCIDTTIYSEHWFRCPNQSKGSVNGGIHIIKEGVMRDFIIDYIPEDSINIDNIINNKQIIEYKKSENVDNNQIIEYKKSENIEDNQIIEYKDLVLSSCLTQPQLYKKIFDECYKQDRFDIYECWITIGMAIKNIFGDNDIGIELFDYYSSKGIKYEGQDITKIKYNTFSKKETGYKVATIYYYAIEDNKPKFIDIMSKNTFELGPTDICKYIKILAGNKFIYTNENNIYKLFCYNGKIWINDDVLLKKFISNELYNFLKLILVEVYWNSKDFIQLKSKIERLKYISMKRDIIETYKEEGVQEITFDDKWWLFGFNNKVYDLKEGIFREYHYNDYITITTGYDWREPTKEEIKTVNELIKKIFPVEVERELYLQILATGMDGRCLEKFTIGNGSGGNGKGLLNDLCLLAFGNYGILGNNSILFETPRTGSNPEKANLHKKRLIIFREPPERRKIENSIMKELTGGGKFSARTHNEKETVKELNSTIILEANQVPLLAEHPQDAEIRRIIDIYFRSTFTTDTDLINEDNYIFMANPLYKTLEWQHKHKYALIKILIEKYKTYINNNSILIIPPCVAERTKNYLEKSMDIISWFKDNFELTNNIKDIVKIKDIYEHFINSNIYNNMTKNEKKKYNKTYFIEYISTNPFFRHYYCEKNKYYRNFIKCWVIKEDNDFSD